MFGYIGNLTKSNQLFELAKKVVISNKGQLAYTHSRNGLNQYNNGNIKEAIELFKIALSYADSVSHDSLVNKPEWNTTLGECYNAIGDSINGKFYTQKGLDLYLKSGKVDPGGYLYYFYQAVGVISHQWEYRTK